MKAVSHRLMVAFCCLAALAASQAVQADTPRAALERMAEAMSELNFRGTFVQIQGGEVESHQVVHRAGEGGSSERLLSLTGSQRELLRQHDAVKCIFAKDDDGDVDLRQAAARFNAYLGDKLKDLDSGHYSLISLGRDRVAGRAANIIGIQPEDELRYGFRFWLDRETGMPLRNDMVSADGEVIQQVMFTDIMLDVDISDEELDPVLEKEAEAFGTRHARYSRKRPGESEQDLPTLFDALPDGFRLVAAQSEPRRAGNDVILHHLILSDGIAQVSIFVEPLGEERRGFEGESRMGSVSAHGRQVDDHQITVVGEVPMKTVTAIASEIDSLPRRLAEKLEP
ncbi:MucB/RseB C-terminal domain-containing protein [Gammaproteobacteria bacterium AB-CW1]|uniref:MucB/RseB C-terminal domain-containing protein n=1 Tax=Natronospira elongata TaxID=3110268 RepID=A0AAP6MML4_9GAMM|nr:MucB/RseB C-terminal domain-containing protein [Gammaproteobacteria bacterium AB-CW1]